MSGFLARVRAVLPKIGAGLAIAVVASVAGVISYGHIFELTLALHQSVLTARLMPVAIDGLITVGSVVLLQSGSRIGWLGVGPGLALSVFANVESGIQYGWLAAVWAGIPALSFFLATFILERWLKSQANAALSVPSADEATGTVAAEAPTAPVSTPETVADTVPDVSQDGPQDADTEEDTAPAIRPVPRRTRGGQTTADKVAALRAKHPDMTQAQMAARLKVSERTVRRHLATAVADTMQEATPVAAL